MKKWLLIGACVLSLIGLVAKGVVISMVVYVGVKILLKYWDVIMSFLAKMLE